MKISAILPVHSEEESVVSVVDSLQNLLREKLEEVILIISPSSPDKTVEICNNISKAYGNVHCHIQKENPGLGRAIKEGFKIAKGSHILMMDSDGEMDPATVPEMIKKMEESRCDMVVGSRWVKGGGVVGYSTSKYFLNRAYQIIFRLLFLTKTKDLTLGFKLLRKEIVDRLHWESEFHDLAVEITLKLLKYGYRIEEVPTTWTARKIGASKNNMKGNFRYVIRGLSVRLQKKEPSLDNKTGVE